MSNPEKIKHDFQESVNEIIDNTRKIKGEQFVTAVSIIFNMHQLVFALGSVAARIEHGGKYNPGELSGFDGMVLLAGSSASSAAILGAGFDEKQANEIGAIAKTLGDLYEEFIKKMNGG